MHEGVCLIKLKTHSIISFLQCAISEDKVSEGNSGYKITIYRDLFIPNFQLSPLTTHPWAPPSSTEFVIYLWISLTKQTL